VSDALNRNVLNDCIQRDQTIARAFEVFAQLRRKNLTSVPSNDGHATNESGSILRSIATTLGVPIILASFKNACNIVQYSSYGISVDNDFCRVALASDKICKSGMQIIPDYRTSSKLSFFTGRSASDMARFYVGLPLKDERGNIIGSLAILQESKCIAKYGLSINKMHEQGKMLIRNLQAQADDLSLSGQVKQCAQGRNSTPQVQLASLLA
jgi:hypothetical protein